MFGESPQGKEICTLLEIGIIPKAAQQFGAWITKFQEKVRDVELKIAQHIHSTRYSDLTADFHHLGSLHQFNSSFMLCGKDVFNAIAASIAAMTNAIVEKIKYDWQEYHGQFLVMFKNIGPQLNAAALEKLKANLVGLIEKLKVLVFFTLPFVNACTGNQ
jgi:hypothetical protein